MSLPVAVIIGAVIIGGSIIFAAFKAPAQQAAQAVRQAPAAAPAPAAPSAVKAADIKAVKATGPQVVGSPSAPIVVAYWYDYQCPVCQRAEELVISQVMAEYVKTGKIRMVFKDLQFLGPDSYTLGVAARAVGEVAPAKFYDWHKAVFENQGQEHSGWATTEKILSITTSVLGKANADKAMALATSKAAAYRQAIDADKAEGSAFGAKATPSFIIGKQLIVGLSSYANIKAAIDAALK